MAEENKGIRLKKAATELNVGVSTLVEFLAKKGHQVESNPNTRLTAEQYDIVATAFQAERAVKEQADKIEITPSGNNVVVEANIEERKDETDEVIIKNYNSSTVETKGTPKPVESAVTPDASQVPESKPEAPAEEVQQPAAEVAEVPAEPEAPSEVQPQAEETPVAIEEAPAAVETEAPQEEMPAEEEEPAEKPVPPLRCICSWSTALPR